MAVYRICGQTRASPVSYTHLDVYKRQPLPDANTDATWINMTPGDPVLPPAGGSITGFTVGCSTYLPVYEVFYYDIDDPFMSELTTGFQSVTMSSVPEPGTMTALALAFGCLAPMMRKLKS